MHAWQPAGLQRSILSLSPLVFTSFTNSMVRPSHRLTEPRLSPMSALNGCTSARLPILHLTLLCRDRWVDMGTDRPGAPSQPASHSVLERRPWWWRSLYPLHTHILPWSHTMAPATRGFLSTHMDAQLDIQTHTHTCASKASHPPNT